MPVEPRRGWRSCESLNTEAGNRTKVLELRSPARTASTLTLSAIASAPSFVLCLDRVSISILDYFRIHNSLPSAS